MDRREKEALKWVNTQLRAAGLDPLTRFPRCRRAEPRDYPVPRLLARVLEVAGHRSPGEAQFSSTEHTYRYWKALKLMEGRYPPLVIEFNRGFAAGEYPHLLV